MSISNLFQPNSFNLYCKNITTDSVATSNPQLKVFMNPLATQIPNNVETKFMQGNKLTIANIDTEYYSVDLVNGTITFLKAGQYELSFKLSWSSLSSNSYNQNVSTSLSFLQNANPVYYDNWANIDVLVAGLRKTINANNVYNIVADNTVVTFSFLGASSDSSNTRIIGGAPYDLEDYSTYFKFIYLGANN